MRPPLNILIIASLGLAGLTCDKGTDPPPYVRSIELNAEDASCTEAWLRVRITDGSQPPFDVRLTRDDQTVQTYRLSTPDSLIIDEGLLPNRTYTYKAYRLTDSRLTDSTTLQTLTTMDTTSSDWVFDPPVLLGDGSSSVLYDVAIINDTLAYAVGEIYKRDSLGNWDPNAYNMGKWDGNSWELIRIPFIGPCSAVDYPPLKAIWAISADQILVTNGGAIATYNGTTTMLDCRMNSLLAGAINKLYATGNQDIYAVGNNGTIVHYASGPGGTGTWRRLESGTDLHVYDVFGAQNPETETLEVYAAAAQQFVSFEKRILQLTPAGVSAMPDSNIPHSIHGIWFDPGKRYYVVGSGMYAKYAITIPAPWRWLHLGVTQYYLYAISGTKLNNITACGAFGEILHFSGATWRSYRDRTAIDSGAYYGVSMKENLIIAVGFESSHAVVAIGRR